jgi:hypothetical protein
MNPPKILKPIANRASASIFPDSGIQELKNDNPLPEKWSVLAADLHST